MSSKTPTAAKKSKSVTTKQKRLSKASPKVTKKKRASTSSAPLNEAAKRDYAEYLLVTADVPPSLVMPLVGKAERAKNSSLAREESRELISAQAYSRRGLYDGITIESTATLKPFAEYPLTLSESLHSQEPQSAEQAPQTYAKSQASAASKLQASTSSPSVLTSLKRFLTNEPELLVGAVYVGAVIFLIALLGLLARTVS